MKTLDSCNLRPLNGTPTKTRAARWSAVLVITGVPVLLSSCQSPTPKMTWRVEPVMRTDSLARSSHDVQRGESLYRLGRYYDGQNRSALADEMYRRAIAADSSHVEARNALGVLLARQGRLDEAITVLQGALALDRTRGHLLSNLGYACWLAGRNGEADVYLREALRIDPENAKALRNLAVLRSLRPEPVVAARGSADGGGNAPSLPVVVMAPASSDGRQQIQLVEMSASMRAVEIAPQIFELRQVPGERDGDASVEFSWGSPVLRSYRLEVANGMGKTGAARRIAHLLRDEGAPVAFLTDQKPYVQARTEIQYAQGYRLEAHRLAERLGGAAVSSGVLGGRPVQVRVILGRDVGPVLADKQAGRIRKMAPDTEKPFELGRSTLPSWLGVSAPICPLALPELGC